VGLRGMGMEISVCWTTMGMCACGDTEKTAACKCNLIETPDLNGAVFCLCSKVLCQQVLSLSIPYSTPTHNPLYLPTHTPPPPKHTCNCMFAQSAVGQRSCQACLV